MSTVQYMRIYRFKTRTLIDLLSTLLLVIYVKENPPVNIKLSRLIERLKCHVQTKGRGEGQEV